jgi:hypothetical protein
LFQVSRPGRVSQRLPARASASPGTQARDSGVPAGTAGMRSRQGRQADEPRRSFRQTACFEVTYAPRARSRVSSSHRRSLRCHQSSWPGQHTPQRSDRLRLGRLLLADAASESYTRSNRAMVWRPDWWCYPERCQNGHEWGPGLITVSWVLCDCPPAQAARGRAGARRGTWRCFCNAAPGCLSVWCRPRHDPLRDHWETRTSAPAARYTRKTGAGRRGESPGPGSPGMIRRYSRLPGCRRLNGDSTAFCGSY